jgi:hypothetical protein
VRFTCRVGVVTGRPRPHRRLAAPHLRRELHPAPGGTRRHEQPDGRGVQGDREELAAGVGARLVTVLDDDYPANLRLIPNLPPFLFLLGDNITDDDLRSVAVVGTRQASLKGISRAKRMATQLVNGSVTVVSGLAAGSPRRSCAPGAGDKPGGRSSAPAAPGMNPRRVPSPPIPESRDDDDA